MKHFPVDKLALLCDAAEDLIRLHLGPDAIFVLVLRQGERINCLSNLPIDKGEELKAIFAELAGRPVQPLP